MREWIHHIGPVTKVISLKLFLDVVTSSSWDLTRALRGKPKRLSRNYGRRDGGNVIVYVLTSIHSRYVLCTLGLRSVCSHDLGQDSSIQTSCLVNKS